MPDPPFYFPLTPDYPVGRAAPSPLRADQFGHGGIDGHVFQFASDAGTHLDHKHALLADHAKQHMGQSGLSAGVESCVCDYVVSRLLHEAPDRFDEDQLRGYSFNDLAMRVPEDMAITRVRYDDEGQIAGDWLAAVHVCTPSGWSPAQVLGRGFAQVHRTVQIPTAKRFLLEGGKVKDYVGQMLGCTRPHVRFIWTLQVGDALNRNPRTRRPADPLTVDEASGESNVYFRVERQTITGFAGVAASLFTIRTYLYPLSQVVADPRRRDLLKQAVTAMPARVTAYKGWGPELVSSIVSL